MCRDLLVDETITWIKEDKSYLATSFPYFNPFTCNRKNMSLINFFFVLRNEGQKTQQNKTKNSMLILLHLSSWVMLFFVVELFSWFVFSIMFSFQILFMFVSKGKKLYRNMVSIDFVLVYFYHVSSHSIQ